MLVVNQETGLPGDGLLSSDDLHAAREKVFNYEWFALVPPTVEELRLAQAKGKADR